MGGSECFTEQEVQDISFSYFQVVESVIRLVSIQNLTFIIKSDVYHSIDTYELI